MRTFVTAMAVSGLFLSSMAFGQETAKVEPKPATPPAAKPAGSYEVPAVDCDPLVPHLSTGVVTPTPEMWFYQEEMRQYMDPKLAVRRAAEIRATERSQRIAALKWYGMSNSRPVCSADPFNGDYSPHWSSGSPNYPYRWTTTPRPWVVIGAGYGGWR